MSYSLREFFEDNSHFWLMGAALVLGALVFVVSLYFYVEKSLVFTTGTRLEGNVQKKYVTAESRNSQSHGLSVSFTVNGERYVKPFKVPYSYYRRQQVNQPVELVLNPKHPKESAMLADQGVSPVLAGVSLFFTVLGGGYFYGRKRVLGACI